ncbi:unnamed protein product [Enterobius vermicularis]|uniref:Uncharacterized protein n=1 Tax=Enterobius vermicularis TaxID=51028 RepID=A0A0N4VM30_ENTVE|nr:unnamed protein product [Enterobius vermicularis]
MTGRKNFVDDTDDDHDDEEGWKEGSKEGETERKKERKEKEGIKKRKSVRTTAAWIDTYEFMEQLFGHETNGIYFL